MLIKITEATARAVTLAEAKAHLRVDFDDEDSTIEALLDAAIETCADECGRAFNQQGFRWAANVWPGYWPDVGPSIALPIAPIVSVVSVNYRDTDGAEQILSADQWYFRATPEGGSVFFTDTFATPTLQGRPGDVWVDFEAGYDAPDYSEGLDPELKLPKAARSAVLLTLGSLYENREDVVIGKAAVSLPNGAKILLSRIRVYR